MEHNHVARYFSTFSGIGGFELGIQRAVDAQCTTAEPRQTEPKVQHGREWSLAEAGNCVLSPRIGERWPVCVGFSEVDTCAIQVYQTHFADHHNYGDITRVSADALPDFELLVGGFPCQTFSLAGKRAGFEDTRGTLFFEIARIARSKQPRLLVLENVKGLLSHDDGRTFHTILSTLDEIGYDAEWEVLNSKHFGVPQNRERVFIVGHLRGASVTTIFPLGHNDTNNPKPTSTQGTFLVHNIYGGFGEERLREFHNVSPTIRTPQGGGHLPTLIQGLEHVRNLTPTECERLQGFPDGWTASVSDNQRYKCLGNAVTVNVVQAIMEELLCGN